MNQKRAQYLRTLVQARPRHGFNTTKLPENCPTMHQNKRFASGSHRAPSVLRCTKEIFLAWGFIGDVFYCR